MKKRAVRCMAVFFSAMLILTLCSRTIYRSTLVKVRAAKPTGGTLKYEYTIEDFEITAEEYLYEYAPFPFEHGLTVERVYVREGERIEPGNSLVSFYPVDGEYLLEKAQKSLRQAKRDMDAWKNELASARLQLEIMMESAQQPAERELIKADMKLLEAGVWNGSATEDVAERYEDAQAVVDYLTALKEAGWIMTSATGGTVCSVEMAIGEVYTGMSSVCRLAEAGEEMSLLFGPLELPDSAEETWEWEIKIRTKQNTMTCDDLSIRDDMLIMRLPSEIDTHDIHNIRVVLESPYEPLLVPCSAVAGESLFLLETDTGDWGEEILVVREKKVVTGNSDGSSCVIVDGIKQGDRLVVYASGGLADGQVVALDSYE